MRRSAKVVLWILTCGLVWSGPQAEAEARPIDRPIKGLIRVATYNVNAGRAGQPATIRAIEQLQADVILLQESSPAWERVIRRRLATRYPHIEFHHPRGQPWGSLGILSKIPFRSHAPFKPHSGPFPAWLIELEVGARKVALVGVHLFPPIRLAQKLGWLKAYARAQVIHRRELEEILGHLAPREPAIIAGDFNEDTLGAGLRWLKSKGYQTALHTRTNTWRWKTPFGQIQWPLDHVVATGRVRVQSARVREVGGSDHLPVVVEMELLGRGASSR